MLVDQDHSLTQLAYLSKYHVHHVLTCLSPREKYVVRFLDQRRMLEVLAHWLLHPILMNPQQQRLDEKCLVSISQRVQFEHDGPREQLRDIDLGAVQNPGDRPKA